MWKYARTFVIAMTAGCGNASTTSNAPLRDVAASDAAGDVSALCYDLAKPLAADAAPPTRYVPAMLHPRSRAPVRDVQALPVAPRVLLESTCRLRRSSRYLPGARSRSRGDHKPATFVVHASDPGRGLFDRSCRCVHRRVTRVRAVIAYCGVPCWIQQPKVFIMAGLHGCSPEPGGGIAPLATYW